MSSTTSPACNISADEFFLTLNGFDEIAIAKAFRADITDLRDKPFAFLRALVFVHQRRMPAGPRGTAGTVSDRDALQVAQNLTIAELGDYFPEAEGDLAEDVDSDDPETDAGKESLPSA